MGKLLQGPNGPFIGKLGTGVGVMWKGINVIRSKPKRRTVPFSPGELAQHARFGRMSQFLKGAMHLLNVTFQPLAVRMTGYNKAFSYNVKNALIGEYPDYQIDYSVVLLGRGDLPNAGSPVATSLAPSSLDFSWADNSGKGKARGTDQAFIASYYEENNEWKYELNVADRSAGHGSMVFDWQAGRTVHAYLGFISADEKEVSESFYAGTVQLMPKISPEETKQPSL